MSMGLVGLAVVFGLQAPGDDARLPPGEEDHRAARQASEGFATADDGTCLYYRIVGDGPRTVIIPVGFYLEPLLDRLASPELRLVFYDPRGRGRSDAVDPARVSLDHQVSDVEALRMELGIERMALIGWSGLGMEMAVYAMRHPERVTRFVQVAPVPPRQTPWAEQGYATRARRYDPDALRRFDERRDAGEFEDDRAGQCRAQNAIVLPALLADPSRLDRIPEVCVHENERPANLGPLFEALLGSFGDYDLREDLRRLEVPRLVIHGDEEAFPLEGSREWVRGHPNARLLVVPGARHFPFVDRPDVFFPAVERFLTGDWPAEAEHLSAPPGPELLNRVTDAYPAYSPDGRRVAYMSNADGDFDIYVLDPAAGARSRLTDAPGRDGTPAWSPDGTRIAFQSFRDGHSQIYVMNADGSDSRNLSNGPWHDEHPAWSADGGRILFASRGRDPADEGNFDLYEMRADGSAVRRVTATPEIETYPSWSPDGALIACRRILRDGNWEVVVMDADGSNARTVAPHPAVDGWPAWSPDGRRIAFTSERAGSEDLWVVELATGRLERLTFDDGRAERQAWWSPDGASLVFSRYTWFPDEAFYEAAALHVIRVEEAEDRP